VFEEGTFNSIIGQSGSGKSTLLNILGTLDKATSGDVLINGKNTQDMKKDELAQLRNETIGFIFQFHYLLPEFTALENVLMPYRISKQPITEDVMKRAHDLLDIVGLTNRKNNLAINLSGGQQQRVAIARAIVNTPSLLLADEPTGNLDTATSDEIMGIFQRLNDDLGITLVVVTHEDDIAQFARRIIRFRDGRLVMDAPVENRRLADAAGMA
jgi:lipoprotein-releasing system ATP-binding protein